VIFLLDVWFLPSIAGASASYLVSLLWERFRGRTAPSRILSGLLSALSFLMSGISAYYRTTQYGRSLENNVIVMFVAAASTTYFYLLLRRYIPGAAR